MTAVPAAAMDRFTVFAADLDSVQLYELLERLASFALAIVGLGRDYAAVALPRQRTSRPREYHVRLEGAVEFSRFEDLGVTVHHRAGNWLLIGRLDLSALHGLLRRAQLADADLLAIECCP